MATILLLSALTGDGGELFLGVGGALEVQQFAYSPADAPDSTGASVGLGGRFAAFARYGVSDTLHLGAGFAYVYTPSLDFEDVAIGPYTGLLYADVQQFAVPFSASLLFDWGYEWNLLATFEAGLSFQSWAELALVDPSNPDASGDYPQYPIDPGAQSMMGVSFGVAIEAEWRILDWLVLDMGPELAMTQGPGGWHWHAGLALRSALVFGLGPSFDF